MAGGRLVRSVLGSMTVLAVAGCTNLPATQATTAPSPGTAVTAASPGAGVPSSAKPSSGAPAAATSSSYGVSLSLDGTRLDYTRVRWYWGDAAKKRCAALGIHGERGELCNDYYAETTRQRLSGTIEASTRILLTGDDAQSHPATRSELARAIAAGTWRYFRIWTRGTDITRIEQVFQP